MSRRVDTQKLLKYSESETLLSLPNTEVLQQNSNHSEKKLQVTG